MSQQQKTTVGVAIAAALLPLALIAALLVFVTVLDDCEQTDTGMAGRVDLSLIPDGPIGVMGWKGVQLRNAAYIMNAAVELGLSRRDQTIGVMTAMGESSLIVIDHGDAAGPDSRGLFQQRGQGWGTYQCRMDPTCSAQSFFRALMKVSSREAMQPTIVAHTVQINADPNHYTKFWPDAEKVVAALAGAIAAPAADSASLNLSNAFDRTTSKSLTVMTYNLLGSRLYKVKWPTRSKYVTRLIRSADPDVIGFQENHSYGKGGQARLLDLPGYSWVYRDHRDAIAYRSTVGQVVDQGIIRLGTIGVAGSHHNRFAVWAKINTVAGGLLLVNAHTENGNGKGAARARSRAYDLLLAALAKINPGNQLPTVLTGDFNASSRETRPVYRDHLVKLGGAGFIDSARQAPNSTKVPGVKSYNGFGYRISGKFYAGAIRTGATSTHIDYIWTAGNVRASGWRIALPAVTWRTVKGHRVAFAGEIGSDHWPVVARVEQGQSAIASSSGEAAVEDPCAAQNSGWSGVPGDWSDTISYALSKVGVYRYSWGGGSLNGPTFGTGRGAGIRGFDCSSFVRFVVYQTTRKELPRDSRSQADFLQSKGFVTRTKDPGVLRAGDIVFFSHGSALQSIYHVALVTKDGWIVEEPGMGRSVQHNPISRRMPYDIWGYARFSVSQLP